MIVKASKRRSYAENAGIQKMHTVWAIAARLIHSLSSRSRYDTKSLTWTEKLTLWSAKPKFTKYVYKKNLKKTKVQCPVGPVCNNRG